VNLPESSIRRPVATVLLTAGVTLAGAAAFGLLPVAPLPQVDFPTISVQAQLPGASPEVMAATVATPLERALGRIAGVTEITSSSSLGSTRVTLQFDLDRDIDGAARDVQAAINAARSQLPTSLPRNPTYRKVNPADAPIMILSLTSDTLDRGEMYDAASTILAQKISQAEGVGQRLKLTPHLLRAVEAHHDPLGALDQGVAQLGDPPHALGEVGVGVALGVLDYPARLLLRHPGRSSGSSPRRSWPWASGSRSGWSRSAGAGRTCHSPARRRGRSRYRMCSRSG